MDTTTPPAITLKVEGMTCGHCARAVTAAIEGKDPLASVAVDLAAGTVTAATILPRQVVAMAVEEEGYAVTG